MENVTTEYNLPLILLSIIVAVFSSFVALDISSRLAAAKGANRTRWIVSGAVVMGVGIWAMHFIAMLAFHFSIKVTYNLPVVLLSILPALISCGIAFYLISRQAVSKLRLVLGAVFIGTGIISMHYLGMEAMEMETAISYSPILWLLSAMIAFVTSLVALYLLIQLREFSGFQWRKLGSAILMGIAVSGMHYTGMAAAIFEPVHSHGHTAASSTDNVLMGYAIGLGVLVLLVVIYSSIRADRRLQSQSDESERKFQSVIESATDAIIVADKEGAILQWNQGAQNIFGYSSDEVLGMDVDLIVPDRYKEAHRKGINHYYSEKPSNVLGKTVELSGRRKDGSEFPLEMSLGSWETEKGAFFSSIIRDITERKNSEEKISSLVYLDPLTGLPNRRLFTDRLASALDQAKAAGQIFAILNIDLDHFKMINDTFGHHIGDQLLKEVASRLEGCAAKSDTVSRFGGDEFVLLLPNTDYGKAADCAKSILQVLNEPFSFMKEGMFITPSIGISMYPSDGEDQEMLMKNADIAMYRVKEEGKNNFQFFTQEMNQMVSRKSSIAISLRKALEQDEFTIHYQPQIDLKTGEAIGVEALLRWTHPKWGSVSPAEFIPVAEETGIIVQIGELVLRQACQQNKDWQEAGLPPFRVAINISARQFSQSNLCQIVREALDESGLEPKYLELELTESIIQGSKTAISTMQELKEMGIHLSIDDFGTGYSSLSYLKLFPIDTLKIDQYFTRNINADVKDAALVDTIIKMAHNLGLNVIAEGVETNDQLEFLKLRECNQAQGYYFNRPVPPEEIERLYQKLESIEE
ncbi:EAL domain-containing protein [Planococcus sp. YIM B11945]|uniref:putative bifunctional diguanylate cyclase/phosphodiesterase n=1 Tax=Planococcus sp. YIM B11945 TaxID=3435410 RepID=UPI003D7D53DE